MKGSEYERIIKVGKDTQTERQEYRFLYRNVSGNQTMAENSGDNQ